MISLERPTIRSQIGHFGDEKDNNITVGPNELPVILFEMWGQSEEGHSETLELGDAASAMF